MARTLLYTVQRVLEKLNLDPVSSLSDTEDSLLIAREAETTFYDLLSRAEWKNNLELLPIESVSNLSSPTMLRLPNNVSKITSVRYDVTTPEDSNRVIRTLQWLPQEDFLEKSYSINTDKDSTQVAYYKGNPLFIHKDRMPTYYTTFDNEYIVLDSYDEVVEDTVVGAKTICYGEVEPSWLEDESFVIPVQDSVYPLYLSMLSAACSIYMNSEISQEDERRQQRGISRMRREQNRTEMEYHPKFNYGRKGNGIA